MRTIKFRAWDKKNKEFAYLFMHGIDAEIIKHQEGDFEGWQQFTGLLDKNGKEIYEGDIVKTKDEKIGEVEWNRYGWSVKIHTKTDLGLKDYTRQNPDALVEIIGNIYENSELLK
jgi:uncharacterized phage protein (TIGR01671 family)